jgi:hypothetical protein
MITLQQEFLNLFTEEYDKGVSREKAYHLAEIRFSAKYNHNKYSGYNSFNVTVCKKVKQLTSK